MNDNKIDTDSGLRSLLSRRLKQLRTNKKMTLEESCNDINRKTGLKLIFSALGNYEHDGYRSPSLFVLVKLAEYYNVSTDYLMGKTDDKNAKIIQTTLFDAENKAHCINIAVPKNTLLSEMPFKDVQSLINQFKEMGYELHYKDSTK